MLAEGKTCMRGGALFAEIVLVEPSKLGGETSSAQVALADKVCAIAVELFAYCKAFTVGIIDT